MATYTSNYGWTKPSGSDNVDISVLNNNLDGQDGVIHDAFLNMAPPFSELSTYAVDDIVLYTTGLYKCHTPVVTPGSWTGSTNWQVYKLSEGGSGGGGTSNYNQLTNKPQINSVELSGNKTAAQLGLMASDGVVANPTGQTTGTLTALEVGGTKYAVPSGGTSDYTDLSNKPQVNGVTLIGNKTTNDLGITASGVGAIPSTDKGANGGVAELDSNGKVPSSQLPSYVDDVLSYASQSAFPATGETGKIYIAEDTNKTYRWSGSAYAEISASLALGETSSTAYRGDRGKTAYDHSQTTGNPHGTTKGDVGLGNVPNVSTNDQTPTFTEASTRNNIASGEKLSVILGKVQKFFNDLKTVAFSGSYTDLSDKPTIPAAQVNSDWNASSGVAEILNKPSSYTPSSHKHGNIQNGGTLQTTDVAIANGDKLVVTDSSNSAKIARTSVAFDGTTTTQALSKKGTFETFSKFSGSYADLTNKPSLATVATSGSYNDLTNKPTIPTTASGITYDNTDSGLTATDVQGAVDELTEKTCSLHVKMDQLFNDSNIPATATSYSCNWTKYDTLVISVGQYRNQTGSIEVPVSYFETTTSNRRIIAKGAETGVTFEVYRNGNNAIYIRASELSSAATIFIYGKSIGV